MENKVKIEIEKFLDYLSKNKSEASFLKNINKNLDNKTESLERVLTLAKNNGYTFTAKDLKEYLSENLKNLNEEDLAKVGGGSKDTFGGGDFGKTMALLGSGIMLGGGITGAMTGTFKSNANKAANQALVSTKTPDGYSREKGGPNAKTAEDNTREDADDDLEPPYGRRGGGPGGGGMSLGGGYEGSDLGGRNRYTRSRSMTGPSSGKNRSSRNLTNTLRKHDTKSNRMETIYEALTENAAKDITKMLNKNGININTKNVKNRIDKHKQEIITLLTAMPEDAEKKFNKILETEFKPELEAIENKNPQQNKDTKTSAETKGAHKEQGETDTEEKANAPGQTDTNKTKTNKTNEQQPGQKPKVDSPVAQLPKSEANDGTSPDNTMEKENTPETPTVATETSNVVQSEHLIDTPPASSETSQVDKIDNKEKKPTANQSKTRSVDVKNTVKQGTENKENVDDQSKNGKEEKLEDKKDAAKPAGTKTQKKENVSPANDTTESATTTTTQNTATANTSVEEVKTDALTINDDGLKLMRQSKKMYTTGSIRKSKDETKDLTYAAMKLDTKEYGNIKKVEFTTKNEKLIPKDCDVLIIQGDSKITNINVPSGYIITKLNDNSNTWMITKKDDESQTATIKTSLENNMKNITDQLNTLQNTTAKGVVQNADGTMTLRGDSELYENYGTKEKSFWINWGELWTGYTDAIAVNLDRLDRNIQLDNNIKTKAGKQVTAIIVQRTGNKHKVFTGDSRWREINSKKTDVSGEYIDLYVLIPEGKKDEEVKKISENIDTYLKSSVAEINTQKTSAETKKEQETGNDQTQEKTTTNGTIEQEKTETETAAKIEESEATAIPGKTDQTAAGEKTKSAAELEKELSDMFPVLKKFIDAAKNNKLRSSDWIIADSITATINGKDTNIKIIDISNVPKGKAAPIGGSKNNTECTLVIGNPANVPHHENMTYEQLYENKKNPNETITIWHHEIDSEKLSKEEKAKINKIIETYREGFKNGDYRSVDETIKTNDEIKTLLAESPKDKNFIMIENKFGGKVKDLTNNTKDNTKYTMLESTENGVPYYGFVRLNDKQQSTSNGLFSRKTKGATKDETEIAVSVKNTQTGKYEMKYGYIPKFFIEQGKLTEEDIAKRILGPQKTNDKGETVDYYTKCDTNGKSYFAKLTLAEIVKEVKNKGTKITLLSTLPAETQKSLKSNMDYVVTMKENGPITLEKNNADTKGIDEQLKNGKIDAELAMRLKLPENTEVKIEEGGTIKITLKKGTTIPKNFKLPADLKDNEKNIIKKVRIVNSEGNAIQIPSSMLTDEWGTILCKKGEIELQTQNAKNNTTGIKYVYNANGRYGTYTVDYIVKTMHCNVNKDTGITGKYLLNMWHALPENNKTLYVALKDTNGKYCVIEKDGKITLYNADGSKLETNSTNENAEKKNNEKRNEKTEDTKAQKTANEKEKNSEQKESTENELTYDLRSKLGKVNILTNWKLKDLIKYKFDANTDKGHYLSPNGYLYDALETLKTANENDQKTKTINLKFSNGTAKMDLDGHITHITFNTSVTETDKNEILKKFEEAQAEWPKKTEKENKKVPVDEKLKEIEQEKEKNKMTNNENENKDNNATNVKEKKEYKK